MKKSTFELRRDVCFVVHGLVLTFLRCSSCVDEGKQMEGRAGQSDAEEPGYFRDLSESPVCVSVN